MRRIPSRAKKEKEQKSLESKRSRRFLVTFILLIVVLYGIVAAPPVNDTIVVPFTAMIASGTATILVPFSEGVVADGTLVTDGAAAVNIENGCNALEACIILVAAIVAFPARIRSKLIAVFAGCVGLQIVNLVRTSSLFLLLKHQPSVFEIAHGGVWQVVLVLLAVGFFLLWSVRQREALASE